MGLGAKGPLRGPLKGSVRDIHKLISNNCRGFPDIATIIFFSEKFVFYERQQVRPVPIRRRVWEQLTQLGGGLQESMRRVLREHEEGHGRRFYRAARPPQLKI